MSDTQAQSPRAISASEESQPQFSRSVFSERYGVHWTIIGTIAGIAAGLVIAIIFFKLAEQRKQFAYTTPVTSIRIFDSQSASPAIRVLDSRGEPITEDVYVTEVVFWNSGNVPIEPSDVREPIKIVLSPVKRIIDLRVTGAHRENIANFAVSEAGPPEGPAGNKKAVQLEWEHLDPGFGVRFQVTYVGPSSIEGGLAVDVQGYIVNAEGISVDRSKEASEDPFSVFIIWLLALAVLNLGQSIYGRLTGRGTRRANALHLAVSLTFFIVVILVTVTKSVFFAQPQPPF